jgi:hypothetical protein
VCDLVRQLPIGFNDSVSIRLDSPTFEMATGTRGNPGGSWSFDPWNGIALNSHDGFSSLTDPTADT